MGKRRGLVKVRSEQVWTVRWRTVVLAGVLVLGGTQVFLSAQNPPRKPASQPPKSSRNTANSPAPQRTDAKPDDATVKAAILQSASWKEVIQRFNDWLSVQAIYTTDEVRHIRARLNAGIDRMNPDQLQFFEADMRAKLDVLTSERALDAQAYLTEKLLVASDAYARKVREQLPDVLSMTPAQIDQSLSIFASKRQSRVQMQSSFEQSRDRRLAANSAQLRSREQQQRDRAARGRATHDSNPNNFTPARDYFPDTGGSSVLTVVGGGFF